MSPKTTSPGALTTSQTLAWRNAVFAIFALPGIAMASWASRLPTIKESLGIDLGQAGILIFAIAVGSIVGLVASSHIIARYGVRATIFAGLIVMAATIMTVGLGVTFGPSFAIVFAGLVFFGAAMGMTDVAMNVSGAANERAFGRNIMPIFHAFFSGGTMLGAALGALAEVAHVPLAMHVFAIAVLIVVGAIVATRFLKSEHVIDDSGETLAASDHSRSWRGRLRIWRDPRVLLIGIVALAAAFAEGSANDWLTIAMVDGHGVTKATGALVFGIFVTAMTAGRLGGVFLLDKFGRVRVLRGSFLLAAAGLLLVIFVPNPVVAAAGVVFWGLGSALGFPVGMSAAADDPKTAAARVSAVATIGYFAFLVGPPVIGFLGQRVGILHALLVVLVLAALGAIVAGAAREPQLRPA